MTAVTVFLVVTPPTFVSNFFELDLLEVPIPFRVLMVLLALAHFFLAILCEVRPIFFFTKICVLFL